MMLSANMQSRARNDVAVHFAIDPLPDRCEALSGHDYTGAGQCDRSREHHLVSAWSEAYVCFDHAVAILDTGLWDMHHDDPYYRDWVETDPDNWYDDILDQIFGPLF